MDYDVNVSVSDQIYNNIASFEIMGYMLGFVHNFLRSDPFIKHQVVTNLIRNGFRRYLQSPNSKMVVKLSFNCQRVIKYPCIPTAAHRDGWHLSPPPALHKINV